MPSGRSSTGRQVPTSPGSSKVGDAFTGSARGRNVTRAAHHWSRRAQRISHRPDKRHKAAKPQAKKKRRHVQVANRRRDDCRMCVREGLGNGDHAIEDGGAE